MPIPAIVLSSCAAGAAADVSAAIKDDISHPKQCSEIMGETECKKHNKCKWHGRDNGGCKDKDAK